MPWKWHIEWMKWIQCQQILKLLFIPLAFGRNGYMLRERKWTRVNDSEPSPIKINIHYIYTQVIVHFRSLYTLYTIYTYYSFSFQWHRNGK